MTARQADLISASWPTHMNDDDGKDEVEDAEFIISHLILARTLIDYPVTIDNFD